MRCHLRRILTYCACAVASFVFIVTVLDFQRPEVFDGAVFPVPAANRRLAFPHRRKWWYGKPATPRLWPRGPNETDDRIPAQLRLVPRGARTGNKTKVILVYTGLGGARRGRRQFETSECAARNCVLTDDKRRGAQADAVLWQQAISIPPWRKPTKQVWVMFLLESPEHTPHLQQFAGLINWTATYRRDSTIVAPYERFTPWPKHKVDERAARVNYARNKTKKVAWFVSNCGSRNGRTRYVEELQKHIDVDIYGECGPLSCPRQSGGDKCFKMLRDQYKFYLAFENSNCKDYITEKLYWNAFLNDIVPVVLGARKSDYVLSCPPNSFIHVDDFKSPKELAAYLHKLDMKDTLYNEYFKWKGTGSFMDTKFWCRLCAMLHDESRNAWYENINDWWRGGDTCVHPTGNQKWASWRDREHSGKRKVQKEALRYGPWDIASARFVPQQMGLTGKEVDVGHNNIRELVFRVNPLAPAREVVHRRGHRLKFVPVNGTR